MVGRSRQLDAGALLLVLAGLSGCGGSAALHRNPPPRATNTPAPTAISQVDAVQLARRSGPGFLDYCPDRPGRAAAQYDLLTPGGGTIPGWCETSVVQHSDAYVITFRAHWDGRKRHGPTGTSVMAYSVPTMSATTSGFAPLISQSGPLPP